MSNKKKLQKIMAEDDRAFQAMSSKQFGRGPIALRSVEQPAKKSPPKKKRASREARGVSQFTVSPFGVFDALSSSLTASMFPLPQASDKVDAGKDDEQGEADESPVQAVSSQASRGEEVSKASGVDNQLPQDSRATEATSVDELDKDRAQDKFSSANLFNKLDVVPGYTFHVRDDGPDVGDMAERMSLGEENNLGPDGVRYDYRTDNLPDNPFKELPEEEPEEDEPEINPLVQKRRDRAQSERAAAARNFSQQRQAPPILGIPDPVPIRPIQFEGEAPGPNGDETLITQDRAATQQIEFAQSMVDITEKMALELQAISIRLRTVELLLDRM